MYLPDRLGMFLQVIRTVKDGLAQCFQGEIVHANGTIVETDGKQGLVFFGKVEAHDTTRRLVDNLRVTRVLEGAAKHLATARERLVVQFVGLAVLYVTTAPSACACTTVATSCATTA